MSFTRRAALASAALLMVAQPVLAAAPAKPAAAQKAPAKKAPVGSDFVPSADAIKAHMTFLADDAMEGREAGTRGYDIAANYVAAQYALLGVKPSGDKTAAGVSYLQRVPLLAYRSDGEGSLTLSTDRKYLLLAGYDADVGTLAVATTTSAACAVSPMLHAMASQQAILLILLSPLPLSARRVLPSLPGIAAPSNC